MTTWTALTTLSGREAAETLGRALETTTPAPTGVGVFEIEDASGLWEVGGYFQAPPDKAALILLAAMYGARDFAVSKLDDRDWVAKVRRELSPVAAGRFTVHGAHDAHRIEPHRTGLCIEAAMAFGTGHHATTQGCLLLLDRLVKRGVSPSRIADIGCGTGILAMAAARLFHCRGLATDIDPTAVAAARENLTVNRVGGLARSGVLTAVATGTRHGLYRRLGPFDLVFANILAGPLKRLAPEIRAILAPGGVAVLSGLLAAQASGTTSVYGGHGLGVWDRVVLDGWSSLTVRRPL